MKQMAVGGNLKAQEMYLNYAELKPIDKIENMGQIQVQKIFITEKDIEEANDIIDLLHKTILIFCIYLIIFVFISFFFH